MNKTFTTVLRAWENRPTTLTGEEKTIQPRLWREGNAPLLPPAAASPPEGEILATL